MRRARSQVDAAFARLEVRTFSRSREREDRVAAGWHHTSGARRFTMAHESPSSSSLRGALVAHQSHDDIPLRGVHGRAPRDVLGPLVELRLGRRRRRRRVVGVRRGAPATPRGERVSCSHWRAERRPRAIDRSRPRGPSAPSQSPGVAAVGVAAVPVLRGLCFAVHGVTVLPTPHTTVST